MEQITKDDLRQFRMQLLNDIGLLLDQHSAECGQNNQQDKEAEWLRSKSIRALLNISPASVQNLRISGKVRYRKVMGSYYYNRTDIMKLFSDDKK